MKDIELFLGSCMFMIGLIQLIIQLNERRKK